MSDYKNKNAEFIKDLRLAVGDQVSDPHENILGRIIAVDQTDSRRPRFKVRNELGRITGWLTRSQVCYLPSPEDIEKKKLETLTGNIANSMSDLD